MNMAGWSKQSTFEQFYYKSIQNDNYARAVLSTSVQSSKFLKPYTVIYEALPQCGINVECGINKDLDVRLEFHEWQGEYMTVSHPQIIYNYGINFMNIYLCAE